MKGFTPYTQFWPLEDGFLLKSGGKQTRVRFDREKCAFSVGDRYGESFIPAPYFSYLISRIYYNLGLSGRAWDRVYQESPEDKLRCWLPDWHRGKYARVLSVIIRDHYRQLVSAADPRARKKANLLMSITGPHRPIVNEVQGETRKEIYVELADVSRPNRSLLRSEIPGGIPISTFAFLAQSELSAPLPKSKIAWIAAATVLQPWRIYQCPGAYQAFLRSSVEQLKKAARIILPECNLRSTQELNLAFGMIIDGVPEVPRNATMVRLAEISKQYHRRRQFEQVAEYANDVYSDIYGISHPNLRLLTTAKELIEEGEKMHHCVATYAAACRFGSRIYSYEKNGKYATVEVGNGYVRQSRGPCNARTEEAIAAQKLVDRLLKAKAERQTNGYCKD